MAGTGHTQTDSRDAGQIPAIAGTVCGLLLIAEAVIVDTCALDGVPEFDDGDACMNVKLPTMP